MKFTSHSRRRMGQLPAATTGERSEAHPETPDRRMLINGELVEAPHSFASINPATGEVVGYAPDGTVSDADAAVAAARRAFDEGRWADDVELRIRCLNQFHQALVE